MLKEPYEIGSKVEQEIKKKERKKDGSLMHRREMKERKNHHNEKIEHRE
jgi:hypothetical protein